MKKRTMYSMHHTTVTPGRLGMTIPFLRMEVAPGDTWSGKVGMLIRFAPLKRALMADLYVDQYVFYVPHRLVYDQWEDFITAGPNSGVSTPPGNSRDLALFLPDDLSTPFGVNGLYRRAYNLVWNEFFRDESLPPIGADTIPNNGAPGPTQPIGSRGNHYIGPKRHWINEARPTPMTGTPATAPVYGTSPNQTVHADDILRAIAEQKLQLKRATYGTRYVDVLKSYGVRVNYSMLQKPEVVATAHGSVNITDVVATGPITDAGKLAGHAISGSRIQFRRKSFSEHGTLLGLVCVRPPFMAKEFRDHLDGVRAFDSYYDPALELLPTKSYDLADILSSGPSGGYPPVYAPWGSWYRQGLSRVHEELAEWTIDHFEFPIGVANADQLYTCETMAANADSVFQDISHGHFQVSAVNGLKALRLVSRGTGIAGP